MRKTRTATGGKVQKEREVTKVKKALRKGEPNIIKKIQNLVNEDIIKNISSNSAEKNRQSLTKHYERGVDESQEKLLNRLKYNVESEDEKNINQVGLLSNQATCGKEKSYNSVVQSSPLSVNSVMDLISSRDPFMHKESLTSYPNIDYDHDFAIEYSENKSQGNITSKFMTLNPEDIRSEQRLEELLRIFDNLNNVYKMKALTAIISKAKFLNDTEDVLTDTEIESSLKTKSSFSSSSIIGKFDNTLKSRKLLNDPSDKGPMFDERTLKAMHPSLDSKNPVEFSKSSVNVNSKEYDGKLDSVKIVETFARQLFGPYFEKFVKAICKLPAEFNTEITLNKVLQNFSGKYRFPDEMNEFKILLENHGLISTERRSKRGLLVKRNFQIQ